MTDTLETIYGRKVTKNLSKMNTEAIGSWAGLVWTALNESNVLGLKQLKKITKLKDKEVFAAIGWLAREGKVEIQTNPDDEKDLLFTLVGDK